MKIVIDIPEAVYDQICKEKLDGIMTRAIRCGIPLPTGHGRLIDGDELASGCDEPYWCRWLSEIEDAPTIVPAEMEVEDTPTAKVDTPTVTYGFGKWIEKEDDGYHGGGYTECSICGQRYSWGGYFEANGFRYCPRCGHRMEVEE